jgi:transcriptional regulator with PAS, ATPase and Fis domain
MQARLLRVLQEREVRPVGSNKVIPIDVRIIAATNKTLAEEMRGGMFRSDLFYRLNILKLKVPPLRSRGADCGLLIEHFMARSGRQYGKRTAIGDEALERLLRYDWPGNIRELENIVERLIVLADGLISSDDVARCLEPTGSPDSRDSMDRVRCDHILKVLAECGGNRTRTAQRLGISRTHLWRVLKSME